MMTKIEDLVLDTWLDIFSYLNVRQRFDAFFQLNKQLNQILFSSLHQISCKNNDADFHHLLEQVLPNMKDRNVVHRLRLANIKRIESVARSDLLQFQNLVALTLHRLPVTNSILTVIKQNGAHLRYLYVSSLVSGDKRTLHKLFETILTLPNLQVSRLRVGIALNHFPLTIASNKSITKLQLIGDYESFLLDRLIDRLRYLSSLRSLRVSSDQIKWLNNVPVQTIDFTVPVTEFTVDVGRFDLSLSSWIDCVISVMPSLQKVTISHKNALNDMLFLDETHWSRFADALPNLQELTLKISRTREVNEKRWRRKCELLTKTMTKNHVKCRIIDRTIS